MMILLSCAKTMSTASRTPSPFETEPRFAGEASHIIMQLSQYNTDELKEILKVPVRIAAENLLRYQDFHSGNSTALPALLSYTGVVFKYLHPADFTEDDFRYAQEHLRITSFCYGLLRPLDKIKPYRLEGNVVLPDPGTENMYSFWRQRLTKPFTEELQQNDNILFNLASDEMKQLFDWKLIEKTATVVTPQFKIVQGGKVKTIVVYTKMARGEMARYILKNRIENPEELKSFSWEGFQFRDHLSDNRNFIFTQE